MKMIFSVAAVAVMLLSGCASTGDAGSAPADNRPVPDKLPPVAAASGATGIPAPDELAAVRDRNSPLFQRSVLFDYDSFVVKPQYAPMLEAHGKFLGGKPKVKIMIQGHADERGSREYNLALGQKRAETVKRSLATLGVRDGQAEAVSFGKERPRDLGHNEEAWAQNRRADIAYPGEY
ncbi:MAG: peptidoglycan-associated lipoprotein [Rhodocyclales bacterium GWA2_65_20]|nr:MAG: peptidoglycan-associated lipoprotein [Rhodocyclales bacterium GWA2_65_20]